jgi:hypothetical protein
MKWVRALAVVLAVFVPGGGLDAQDVIPFRVLVRVVSASGEAVEGALLRLVVREETVAQRITDERGEAAFQVRSPGTYRFAVDRLGYAAWQSRSMSLESSPIEAIELVVSVEPVALAEIFVPSGERCSRKRPLLVRVLGGLLGRGPREPTPADAARLVRVHEHAMSALRNVISTRSPGATYIMRVVDEEPVLRNSSVQVGTSHDSTLVRWSAPLDAPSAEILAVTGYMEPGATPEDIPTYHALTPEIVTSETFTLTHCFQAVEEPDSGWVGLAFEPLPGSQSYDVRGVVWVDTILRRPARIDFDYTRLAEFLVESGEWRKARAMARRDIPALTGRLRSARRFEGVRTSTQLNVAAHPTPNEREFGGTIDFGPSGEHGWDITRWQARWPGLVGRGAWGGHVPAGSDAIDFTIVWSTMILHFSRTAELVDVISRHGPNESAAAAPPEPTRRCCHAEGAG